MKVIKEGRKQDWSRELKCTGKGNGGGGCGAILLVEQKDVFKTSHSWIDGETDYYNTFKCCECGVLTDIKEHLNFNVPSKQKWEEKNQLEIVKMAISKSP